MGQFIALVIIFIIAKLLIDFLKEQFTRKSTPNKSGEVIDISDAWVDTSKLPYQKKAQIMNTKEQAFYQLLAEILAHKDYIICPHIPMSELISVNESPNQQEYFQRLKDRTLDLAVLEVSSFKPVLAINLEEPEAKKKQQLSNNFTVKAMQAAGLPLLSINLDQFPRQQDLLLTLRKHGLNI